MRLDNSLKSIPVTVAVSLSDNSTRRANLLSYNLFISHFITPNDLGKNGDNPITRAATCLMRFNLPRNSWFTIVIPTSSTSSRERFSFFRLHTNLGENPRRQIHMMYFDVKFNDRSNGGEEENKARKIMNEVRKKKFFTYICICTYLIDNTFVKNLAN